MLIEELILLYFIPIKTKTKQEWENFDGDADIGYYIYSTEYYNIYGIKINERKW